jgi:hypothetical protein
VVQETISRNWKESSGEDVPLPACIEYDIIFSPSYKVPTLYFTVRDALGRPLTELEAVLSHVVPMSESGPLQDVGVVGGLSVSVSNFTRKSWRIKADR